MRSKAAFVIEQLEERRLLSFAVTPFTPGSTTVLSGALLASSSNITLSGSPAYVGQAGQSGTFNGFNFTSGPNTITMPDGIILTSGLASLAQGSPSGADAEYAAAGDSDLTTLLSGNNTHDANILTLSFTTGPSIHSISFDLLFGSNEAPGASFSDVFGAFLDGTQISFDNGLPIDVGNDLVTYDNSGFPLSGKTSVSVGVGYDWLTGELSTSAPLNTGITTHTLKLAIADAGDDEVDSGVFLSHLQAGTAVIGGATTGTPTVPGSFQVDQSTGTVANTTSTIDLTVDRVGGSDGSTTIDYATADGTAAAGTDYTAKSGTLTFAAGETSKVVTVTILNNPAGAATSTFTLTLSNATGGASLGSPLTDTVTIQNSQSQVQLAAATYSFANNAGSGVLTVTRAGNTGSSATVMYATSDGTAADGTDYTSTSGTLTFNSGQTSKTISVPLLDNAGGASSATFTVTLSSPGGNGVLGTQTSSVVTVQNNASSVQLAAATYTFSNTSGSGLLTVSRTGNLSSAATIDFATADGTAMAGVDYVAATGTLTFAIGQSSKTATVTLLPNASGALTSTFAFMLTTPGGNGVVGTQSSSTVTVQNNHSALSFDMPAYTFATVSGTAALTITRSGNTTSAASIHYATSNGTAHAGSDYSAASGTVNFASGETSKTINITLLHNSAGAAASTMIVTLSSPGGNGAVGTQNTTTVTLLSNTSVVQFGSATYSFSNQLSVATLVINRIGNLSLAARVDWISSDQTALAGTDYTLTSGTAMFAASQASVTITVPLLGNAEAAATTDFTVDLSDSGGNAVLGATSSADVELQNSRSLLAFDSASYQFLKTDSTASLTIVRTGNLTSAASVDWTTTDGTALNGVDYTSASGTLNFLAGEASQTIDIALLATQAAQSGRTFNVVLSNAGGNGAIAAQTSAVVSIAPVPSTVSFANATLSAMESDGSVTVEVTRSGDTQLAGSIDYSTADGTAVAGVNYLSATGTLVFAAGQTSASFEVSILQDFQMDPTLTLQLSLSNPAGGVTTIGQGSAVLSITDVTLPVVSNVSLVTPTVVKPTDVNKPITALMLNFQQPLATAPQLSDFTLYRKTPDGKAGRGRVKKLPLASATYDTNSQALTVQPRTKLPQNHFYQFVATGYIAQALNGSHLDGAANASSGTNFTYSFARGRLLRYIDRDGNHVRLELDGPGTMMLTRGPDGQGETLTLTGTTSASKLIGKVRSTHLGGDGTSTLNSITGLGAGVNQIDAALVIAGGVS